MKGKWRYEWLYDGYRVITPYGYLAARFRVTGETSRKDAQKWAEYYVNTKNAEEAEKDV